MSRVVAMAAAGRVVLLSVTSATAIAAWTAPAGAVQDTVEIAVRAHVRALEDAGSGSLEDAVARFEAERFSPAYMARTTAAQRRQVIDAVRAAARNVDEARVMRRADAYVLVLAGARTSEITFTVDPAPPYRIASLVVSEAAAVETPPPSTLTLTRDNLAETFDRLERSGLAGAVSVVLDGSVAFERAFGQANPELGVRVQRDTVFATGSFPIEYTVASILMLDQQKKLRLDDAIDRYLPEVSADKRAMTLRHLLNGQSGLPDFLHIETDWDRDLAWIDRATAERRILGLPLRFAPGSGRAHSHAAFGLLAAIIERVAGESYPAFVRRTLLEPAGMTRSGFYGESKGLRVGDFAVGHGSSSIGVPNIPPNWGPTSWLVMGSGGMYATLPDLVRFHAFVRSGTPLDEAHATRFRSAMSSVDGSDRGFELFHVYNPPGREVFLLVNASGPGGERRELFRALARLAGMSAGR
jgi:CubicO group peptidase (beta-lactamase class C family)